MATKKRIGVLLLVMAAACMGANAQNTSDDFDSFRKSMYSGFSDFRQNILSSYASFLEGVWRDYNVFRGVKKDPVPKPKQVPDVEKDKPQPQDKPVVTVPKKDPEPMVDPEPKPEPKLEPKPAPAPAPKPVPAPAPTPVSPAVQMVNVDLFGLDLKLPKVEVTTLDGIGGGDLSEKWGEMLDTDLADDVITALKADVVKYRMGDWQTFQYARRYAARINSDANTQMFITHFMLVALGYDSRVGVANGSDLVMLLPFDHMIYARTYLDKNGEKFFIFASDNAKKIETVSTYDTSAEQGALRALNLVIKQEPLLPNNAKTYLLKSSKIKVTGTVNRNLIALMDGYPQMPVPGFAMSDYSSATRRDVVEQIKRQVQGMSTLDAVNTILDFVQKAFEYATDDEQFGYEKPFFFEETLYYPYCDCEDRAVFYTYLLRNVLGMDAQLVHYPGHEAAVVVLPNPINGVGYRYNGKVYYISDPTYIGASTGMCMPDYENTAPELELY